VTSLEGFCAENLRLLRTLAARYDPRMKFPDELLEKLKTQKQDNDVTYDHPIPAGEGMVVVNYFWRMRPLDRVFFPDTPEARADWLRTMTEAMNPGTGAGASP
jgi:hypothetical protein